jgi:hypothetical protein
MPSSTSCSGCNRSEGRVIRMELTAQHAHCSGPRLSDQGTMEAEDCGTVGQCVSNIPAW